MSGWGSENGRHPNMRDGWSETPFSQALSSPVRNGVYKKKEFHGYGVKIVNMGELFANPRLGAIPMRRVHLSESEQGRFGVHLCRIQGDLLFNWTDAHSSRREQAGTFLVWWTSSTDREPTTFQSSIIRARPDPAKSDSLFLWCNETTISIPSPTWSAVALFRTQSCAKLRWQA